MNLALFLGPNSSLAQLDGGGSIGRELAFFRAMNEKGVNTSIVSHGGRGEFKYVSQAPGIRLLCNWIGLPTRVYDRRAHQAHGWQLLKSHVAKSHDANGLITALRASWAWGMPLVAKVTYLQSELLRMTAPDNNKVIKRLEGIERSAFTRAAQVIVATEALAEKVALKAPDAASKLTVIPNFVDLESFRPMQKEKRYDLIFVGRVSKEKNLEAILEAVERLGLTIAIIGGKPNSASSGAADPEMARIHKRFGDLNGKIDWRGTERHDRLPAALNLARAFIIGSHSEGQPRALIEAMACGLPCIGSNISGIQNVLQHEVSGYLCQTDSDSIAAAIKTLLAKPDLMSKLGKNARRVALEKYALPEVAKREHELLLDVVRRYPVESRPKRLAHYLLRRR